MSLISPSALLSLADKIAAEYELAKTVMGTLAGGAVAGNLQFLSVGAYTTLCGTADPDQIDDLSPEFIKAINAFPVERMSKAEWSDQILALESHCSRKGPSVDATIIDLSTYLASYNGGVGNPTKYSNLVHPSFNDAFQALHGGYLIGSNQAASAAALAPVCFSPCIGTINGNTNGMGKATAGGAYIPGDPLIQSITTGAKSYAEVKLIALVEASFANGSSAPQINLTGVTEDGTASQQWNGTFGSNNPLNTTSTTITPAITLPWTRQTVTLGSTANIVPGSWLTVNNGFVDQESILVEAVAGGQITAVFKKTHLAGSVVSTPTAITLVNAGGKRCRSISNITLIVAGHNAGTVRIESVQERAAV